MSSEGRTRRDCSMHETWNRNCASCRGEVLIADGGTSVTDQCNFPGCSEESTVPAVLKDGENVVGATSYCAGHAEERGLDTDTEQEVEGQ